MSELNVYHHELRPNEYAEFYLKYEADKVLADLEESHKMEVEQLLMEIVKLKGDYKEACGRLQTANLIKDEQLAAARHQKCKRCLAMAKWCEAEMWKIRNTPLCEMFAHEVWQHDDEFWQRWHSRWLDLAYKFKDKEAK